MSKHIPRSYRWDRLGPSEYRSGAGLSIRFLKGAWWAELSYRLRAENNDGGTTAWDPREERLGPFKRPRNAMVEAERHVTALQNRFGERLVFGRD